MLRHLSIGTKMILTFLVVIALTAIIGIFAIVQNNRLATIVGQTAGSDIPSIHSITQMEGLVGGHRRGELLMLLATDKDVKQMYVKRNEESVEKLVKEQGNYEKLMDTDEEKKLYGEFMSAWATYLAEYPKVKELALQGGSSEEMAKMIFGTSSKSFNNALAAMDGLQKISIEQSNKVSNGALAIAKSTTVWIIFLFIACILIGVTIVILFSREMSGPLKRLSADAELVASGDLGVVVQAQLGRRDWSTGAVVRENGQQSARDDQDACRLLHPGVKLVGRDADQCRSDG